MGNSAGDKVTRCMISDLFPYPSIYRAYNRSDILSYGKIFATKVRKNTTDPLNDKMQSLYKLALNCTKYDKGTGLHPLQMAAGVLYSDDSMDVAWQLKGKRKRECITYNHLLSLIVMHLKRKFSRFSML